MPKQAPIAINFQPGDPVKQVNGVIEGVVTNVALVENKPVYMVRYIDPSTGDTDERAYEDGQIVDHEGGDEAAAALHARLPSLPDDVTAQPN